MELKERKKILKKLNKLKKTNSNFIPKEHTLEGENNQQQIKIKKRKKISKEKINNKRRNNNKKKIILYK